VLLTAWRPSLAASDQTRTYRQEHSCQSVSPAFSPNANVRRFIMQSGIGLSDGRELSWLNRFVVRVSGRIFTAAGTDKAVAERMTQKIDMEWVIVRPVVLVDKPAKERYTAGPSARVAPLIPLSFDDCADCLLRAATDEPNWIGKIVNVGS
jgi:hypothetical protein